MSKSILLLFLYLIHGSRSQLCGVNEEFQVCGTACPKRCGEPPAEFCTYECVQGCFCKEGYCLDGSDKCVPDCGMNEVFSSCGTFCPEICGQPEPDVCATGCVEGCFCEEGYCFDQTTGNCMEKGDIMTCGPNEEYSTCGSACPQKCGEEPELCIQACQEGCFCKEGYCLDEGGKCVPSCGPNEVFNSCGSSCPQECGKPPPKFCDKRCQQGCFCKEGYCLDARGNCVTLDRSCGRNKKYSTCGSTCSQRCGNFNQPCPQVCEEGCFCKQGYCLGINNRCYRSVTNP